MRPRSFSLLILMCVADTSFSFGGELQKKIGGEIGYFSANHLSSLNRDNVIAIFSGLVKWDLFQKNNQWLFQLRFRPEYYGFRQPVFIFNAVGEGQFKHFGKSWETGLGLSVRRQNYYGKSDKLFYNFATVNPDFTWRFCPQWALEFQSNYFLRHVSGASRNSFHSESLSGKTTYQFSMYGVFSAGGYAEQFGFKNYGGDVYGGHGWRAGPQCGFEFSHNFIVNFSYQLLSRHLDNRTRNSVENHFTALLGKNFTSQWSAFLYLDYVSNRASVDEADSLFTDIKNVSFMTFKFTYHQTQNIDWFFKVNYLSNRVINLEQTLTGAHLTVGIEIKK